MSRLFPSRRKAFTQEKYRIIEWTEEKKRNREKKEEAKLTKEEFVKRWKENKDE